MEQIEKLARLVNMEPLLVIIIGAGIILVIFGLGAVVTARRRKRITRAKEKALDKPGSIDTLASLSKKVNEPFATLLTACHSLPEGDGFFIKEEVSSALSDLDRLMKPRPAKPRKKKSGDLSLVDYSARDAGVSISESTRKPMLKILKALYMDQDLFKAMQKEYAGELKKAVDSLTD